MRHQQWHTRATHDPLRGPERHAPAAQTTTTTTHTPTGLGCCRERHVHNTTTATNGTHETPNDPNAPFTTHPTPRTCRSRHPQGGEPAATTTRTELANSTAGRPKRA